MNDRYDMLVTFYVKQLLSSWQDNGPNFLSLAAEYDTQSPTLFKRVHNASMGSIPVGSMAAM